jgi:hypothetical protein
LEVLLEGVVWGGASLQGERYSPRGEGEEEGGISLWGLWFLLGAYQDGRVLSGTHQDGQERIRMGGSC